MCIRDRLRLVRPTGTLRYAMAEWGRTREGNARKADIFSFSSWLAGMDMSFSISKVGLPEDSIVPITHAFTQYMRNLSLIHI